MCRDQIAGYRSEMCALQCPLCFPISFHSFLPFYWSSPLPIELLAPVASPQSFAALSCIRRLALSFHPDEWVPSPGVSLHICRRRSWLLSIWGRDIFFFHSTIRVFVLAKVQIPLDGTHPTLSETRASDKVRWVRTGLRQVRGLCLIGSGPVWSGPCSGIGH